MSNVIVLFKYGFILAVILLVVAALLGPGLEAAFKMPDVIVRPEHQHDESAAIRNCNNILSIWLDPKCERFNVLKKLDDGQIGNQVVQTCKRGALEITAYILTGIFNPKDAENILKAKGCTQVLP